MGVALAPQGIALFLRKLWSEALHPFSHLLKLWLEDLHRLGNLLELGSRITINFLFTHTSVQHIILNEYLRNIWCNHLRSWEYWLKRWFKYVSASSGVSTQTLVQRFASDGGIHSNSYSINDIHFYFDSNLCPKTYI